MLPSLSANAASVTSPSTCPLATIRKEIQDETDRLTGQSKAISNVPIHPSAYSPHVVNLTLVDLPGLTKVAVEGQAESIVEDIENMVQTYVSKGHRIPSISSHTYTRAK